MYKELLHFNKKRQLTQFENGKGDINKNVEIGNSCGLFLLPETSDKNGQNQPY